MSSYKKAYISQYGNTQIPRAKCPICNTFSFVIDNIIQCCDVSLKDSLTIEGIKIECLSTDSRNLSRKAKDYILKLQDNRCIYCNTPFGFIRYRNGKKIKLRIEFDHFVPYNYARNSDTTNIVAACHVCNRLKSYKIFDTIEECQVYLKFMRQSKGYNF